MPTHVLAPEYPAPPSFRDADLFPPPSQLALSLARRPPWPVSGPAPGERWRELQPALWPRLRLLFPRQPPQELGAGIASVLVLGMDDLAIDFRVSDVALTLEAGREAVEGALIRAALRGGWERVRWLHCYFAEVMVTSEPFIAAYWRACVAARATLAAEGGFSPPSRNVGVEQRTVHARHIFNLVCRVMDAPRDISVDALLLHVRNQRLGDPEARAGGWHYSDAMRSLGMAPFLSDSQGAMVTRLHAAIVEQWGLEARARQARVPH